MFLFSICFCSVFFQSLFLIKYFFCLSYEIYLICECIWTLSLCLLVKITECRQNLLPHDDRCGWRWKHVLGGDDSGGHCRGWSGAILRGCSLVHSWTSCGLSAVRIHVVVTFVAICHWTSAVFVLRSILVFAEIVAARTITLLAIVVLITATTASGAISCPIETWPVLVVAVLVVEVATACERNWN